MHPKYWKRHVLREQAGEGSAGGGALDIGAAAASFPMGGETADEAQVAQTSGETEEQAAERLATEQAKADAGVTDEPQTEEATEPAKFTIKVDGKDVTLTETELAEHYKNGLRQADYTKKTMETADARKTAEAEANKARQERDSYAQKLQHFAIQSHGEVTKLAEGLTEELLSNDPVEYLRIQHTLQARQVQLQQAQQELQQITAAQQQEQAQAHQTYQAEQLEKLHAKLPDWKDPAKAKAEAQQIKDYLGAQEFGPEDIAQLGDHRLILLARKAMQFDALQAKAREAVKAVQKAPPKVEKPGNGVSPTDGRTRAMKNLDASGGSLNAAAGVFAQFL